MSNRHVRTLTLFQSNDSAELLPLAQRWGVTFWPGQHVTYRGQPGTVMWVSVEGSINVDGTAPEDRRAHAHFVTWYRLALDNGEFVAEASESDLVTLTD